MKIRHYLLSIIIFFLMVGSSNVLSELQTRKWYRDIDLEMAEREYQHINKRAAGARSVQERREAFNDLLEIEPYYYDMLNYFQKLYNSQLDFLHEYEEEYNYNLNKYYSSNSETNKFELQVSQKLINDQQKYVNIALKNLSGARNGLRKVQDLKNHIMQHEVSSQRSTPQRRGAQPSGDTLLGESFDTKVSPGIYGKGIPAEEWTWTPPRELFDDNPIYSPPYEIDPNERVDIEFLNNALP